MPKSCIISLGKMRPSSAARATRLGNHQRGYRCCGYRYSASVLKIARRGPSRSLRKARHDVVREFLSNQHGLIIRRGWPSLSQYYRVAALLVCSGSLSIFTRQQENARPLRHDFVMLRDSTTNHFSTNRRIRLLSAMHCSSTAQALHHCKFTEE